MALPDFDLTSGVNIASDPVTETLFVYYTSNGQVAKQFSLSNVLFSSPTVGTKLVDNDYFTIEVVDDPPSFEVQVTLADAAFEFGSGRALGAAFTDAIETLDAAQGDGGVAVGALSLLRAELAFRTPATFEESLLLNYSYVSQTSGQKMGYVDLVPGMRVRLQSEVSQLIPQAPDDLAHGYVTVGTGDLDVVSTVDSSGHPVLGFDAFLSSLAIPTVPVAPGGLGGLIDLSNSAFQRRHLRLCYPASFPAGNTAGSASAFDAVVLLGADSLKALAAATTSYYNRQTPDPSVSMAYFRGRATLVPGLMAFVNTTPTFLPVGTTCRNLISRFAPLPSIAGLTIPSSSFSNQYKRPQPCAKYVGALSNNAWANVFAQATPTGPPNLPDVYDFPILAGDSIKTGNAF